MRKILLASLAVLPFLGVNSNAQEMYGVIKYELVNVRSNSNIDSSISFVAKKGENVKILEEVGGWYKISLNNKTGWIQKNAVNNLGLSSENILSTNIKTSEKAQVKVVNHDGLNLRKSASTNSSVIASLKKGDRLKVISETVGWAKVEIGSKVGYVSSRFISSVVEESKSGIIKVVASDNLNARKEMNATSTKVFTLQKGDRVEFISSSNGWDKIRFNSQEGYVSSYYVYALGEESNIEQDSKIGESDAKTNTKTGEVKYESMNMSLDEAVNIQMTKAFNTNAGSKASKKELLDFMNPDNYTDFGGRMQFARLDRYSNVITVSELNSYLNSKLKSTSVFRNQGQAFIDAARDNNIDVLYLVAHSIIESAGGTSKLARGNVYNGKTVYNFFGIGAVDGNALNGGIQTAYKNGWTSVSAGISGAAKWISSNYIHSSKYDQNTLYKMKYSSDTPWHQYASSITWASSIGNKMAEIANFSSKTDMLNYEIPRYN